VQTVRAILQPFSGTVRDSLEALAERAAGGVCRAVSAWATIDGIALLNDMLSRHQVGFSELIVGINRMGTSARALRAGVAATGQSGGLVRYYLDGPLNGLIFHAKMYFFESPSFRGALVGSPNLTREGFLNNVESGLILFDVPGEARTSESKALDEIRGFLDGLATSIYAVPVVDGVIERLVEIGAIPESTQSSQRDDADSGGRERPDEALNISPRARSVFRPITALPSFGSPSTTRPGGVSTDVSLEVPVGSSLRYVRFYGLSEANRVQKFFRNEVGTGTFEVNITMTTAAEKSFWQYPDRFVDNLDGSAREWRPRVRLITVRDGETNVTPIPSARLWTRIRDGRESEVRFRFASTGAVRSAFPKDIEELTVMVVDRVDDLDADFEVRLVGKADPGYSALRPVGDYEYRVV
jgi:hypothetical protein